MRTKHFKISTTTIGLLCICIVGANASNTSALTYQSSVTNSFTINESVSIKLSESELKIDNLTPGNAADSNIVTITAETNSSAGYTLYSTVGSSTYDTTDLTQSGVDDKFSILTVAGSLSEGRWGYSYSDTYDDAGEKWTGWSDYAGLIKYDDTESTPVNLINANSAATTTIAFKIGAQATATQASGEYNNVINFIAVTAPTPPAPSSTCTSSIAGVSSMQSFASLSSTEKATVLSGMTEDAEYGLKDERDGKVYCVAKLKDGHVWMTQNLDLDLSTSTELKHTDTDLGWGTDTTTTTWTPAKSTIDAKEGAISNWADNNNVPYSVDVGDWYWKGKTFYVSTECSSNACRYIDKSGANYATYFAAESSDDTNGSHGHVGNYYNWSAAVAMNSTSSYSSSTFSNITKNPQNSICPAGWRLPTIYSSSTSTDTRNEFYVLLSKYSAYVTSGTERDKAITASPLFFVRGGLVNGGALNNAGYYGYYWSSTVYSSSDAYNFLFGSSNGGTAYYYSRLYGRSVRCIVR